MNKKIKFVLITIIIIGFVTATSYLVFAFGITDMISANLQKVLTKTEDYNQSDLPVIEYVINSSGEKLVNTDVVLTINASSKYNINKVEYSYDLKNWKEVKEKFNDKEITTKIIFTKTMNKTLYVKVTNEKGYVSYAYETKVKIDKENPSLNYDKDGNDIIISASDNLSLATFQYSNDKENWDEEEISGENITLREENFGYKYIRVVDGVGNISSIKTIK